VILYNECAPFSSTNLTAKLAAAASR